MCLRCVSFVSFVTVALGKGRKEVGGKRGWETVVVVVGGVRIAV